MSAAVSGKRAVALATVAPARQGERTDRKETSAPEDTKSKGVAHEKRLRAIAERAPEPVRETASLGRFDHMPRRVRVSFDEQRDSLAIAEPVEAPLKSWLHVESLDRLSESWPDWTTRVRKQHLKTYCAHRFQLRFGRSWDPKWIRWAKHREAGLHKRTAARSRLVHLLDRRNVLNLPERVGGDSRFLSVAELSWISILCGSWPRVPRGSGPRDVLAAERACVKTALKGFKMRPVDVLAEPRTNTAKKFVRVRPKRGKRDRST